jgi:hypothetical protein
VATRAGWLAEHVVGTLVATPAGIEVGALLG